MMAKSNNNYGKVIDGALELAPNKLIVESDGRRVQIFNAPESVYVSQGWLPIAKAPQPTAEDGYYTPTYTEVDGEIVQSWVFVPFGEAAYD